MVRRTEVQRAPAPPVAARPSRPRSLVLVAGSGRSGTSLLTGALQRLGFRVPRPEIPADYTNPRGFGESRWVVDFHSRLLRRAGVHVPDARPASWAKVAKAVTATDARTTLTRWLEDELGRGGDLVVKDPRLSWFVQLWEHCAEDVGAEPRFVVALRHPAAVAASRRRSYGEWHGDVNRVAAWVNQALHTEHTTRGARRTFVLYDDLLSDAAAALRRVGDALELHRVRAAAPAAIDDVRSFVDPHLNRSPATWEGLRVPAELRELAETVWELLVPLARGAAPETHAAGLDAARAAYAELYANAEAVAQSSIVAARAWRPTARDRATTGALRLGARALPRRLRRKVPLEWRRAIAVRLHARRG